MATDKGSGPKVDSNKENSDKETSVGIEANDLATLLNRFEEATSSDDINLPRAVHRAKWNIMKAKSAGNSPAVTPPATPPPTHVEGAARLKTFTQSPSVFIRNRSTPIRLALIPPSTIASTVSPSVRLTTNSFTKISSSALVSTQPKVHIQISNPAIPMRQNVSTTSSPVILAGNINPSPFQNIKNEGVVSGAKMSILPQPVKQVIKIPFQSDVSQISSNQANIQDPAAKERTYNVLRMPALDAASSFNFVSSSTSKQIIPKKRSSTLSNATEVGKKRKLEYSPTVVTTPASSMSGITSNLMSTATLIQQHPSCIGSGSSLQVKSQTSSEANTNVTVLPNKPAQNEMSKASRLLEAKLQRDEHAYCWSGPCFNNKSAQRNGLSTVTGDSCAQTSVLTYPVPFESKEPSEIEETVFEEGEIYVDANGNDMFSKESSNVLMNKDQVVFSQEEGVSNRVVCFDTDGETINRRGRKYRRRGELSDSPVREDKSDFFDKIPSYYTALSIPAKEIKKSAFKSVSDTVGSQDHLAMPTEFDMNTQEEEGQYNKVPAHHRIFTNTSQDIDFPEEICSLTQEDAAQQGRTSRVRRISSASRHSGHSTSSHRSNKSGSRHSFGGGMSRSRSRSPGQSNSQDSPRQSRPVTRRRRNSSSQHSASSYSSSCSSNSYCSTCGASLSRSRSRSFSSDGSRERSYSPKSRDSRSRSRSPRGRSRRRSSRSSTPENRRRWRSESHSQSPVGRRRRNSYRTSSRSRRHQMKERTSAERKIMEQRKQREEEKIKAMEERRVLYVGKLPDNYTKHQLRKRFERFGEIKNVRLNFRVHGDNYGFVTYGYACDAFAAKEKGNNVAGEQKFDLCFGGRRRFCPDKYADLDGNREIEEEYAPVPSKSTDELDYAALLKQHVSHQKKMKR